MALAMEWSDCSSSMTSAAVAAEPRTAENPIRRGATEDRILKFMKLWVPSADAVELMGPLPDEVDVVVVDRDGTILAESA